VQCEPGAATTVWVGGVGRAATLRWWLLPSGDAVASSIAAVLAPILDRGRRYAGGVPHERHQTLWAFLRGHRLNVLVLFLPLAVALRLLGADDLWVFLASALAIVPLAGLIGTATDEAAKYVGAGLGGFLSATFGNAAELIIALLALQRGLTEVVKASITGSVLGNLLLVLGLAMLVGGWNRDKQSFNRTQIGASTGMLVLTTAALLMPDIYAETISSATPLQAANIMNISVLVAVVMLGVYLASLMFSFKTHRHLVTAAHSGEPPELTRRDALVLLVLATLLTAAGAETLVGSIEHAAERVGLSDLFVGAVVVAIVGNAAEHFSAVLFARRDQTDLAVGIAVTSAIQVALLVAPIAVLASLVLGHPMPLVFDHFELGAIVFAVLGVSYLCLDGESNWFEGLLLLALYMVMAIIFFFVETPTPGVP
ncbi:MAG: calcium/proton exchanger, partial [Chloroflexota bacterium]|nr:calcium/proton exchanger [Chloroflexota bacterium]